MKAGFVAAAALVLSASVYAEPPANNNSGEGYQSQADAHFVSTKTRAQVRAETIAALRRGDVNYGESYPFNFSPVGPAPRTRAEVRAEMAAVKTDQQPRDTH